MYNKNYSEKLFFNKHEYFPEEIAANYDKSGVGAISILTEQYFFKGHLDHLSLNRLVQ